MQDLDLLAGIGKRGGRFAALAFGEARLRPAGRLGGALEPAGDDLGHVAACRLGPAAGVGPGLALGALLGLAVDVGELAAGDRQIMLGGGQVERLPFAIGIPVTAIEPCPDAGELENAVDLAQEFAVVADDKGAAAPVAQQVGHRGAAIGIEVVGWLVEQQDVGLLEQQGGERQSGALASAQRADRTGELERGQAHAGHRLADAGRQGPVRGVEILRPALAGLDAGKASKRGRHAKGVGDAGVVRLYGLAQHAKATVNGDRAAFRRDFAGDGAQQRGLAGAVAADDAGALGAKAQVEILEKVAAVRRCERDGLQLDAGHE